MQLYLSSETIKHSPSGTLPFLHGILQIRGLNHSSLSLSLSLHLQKMHFHVWLHITLNKIATFESLV